jgi:hypothetical protein
MVSSDLFPSLLRREYGLMSAQQEGDIEELVASQNMPGFDKRNAHGCFGVLHFPKKVY